MPSATPRSAELAIRPATSNKQELSPRKLKHAPCTSYPDPSPLSNYSPVQNSTSATPYYEERPSKRHMRPKAKGTIAVVNSSGRQAASFIRVASAVGYNVRAQLRNLDGIVANEIASLPNVEVIVGDLYIKSISSEKTTTYDVNHTLITELFKGVNLAFINTTFYGDEIATGKALADAAVAADVEHYIYSSMPDYSKRNPSWPSLPLWSSKLVIETYIRSLPTLAPRSTFLYTGIYNNNFTSLPYPLFCMELQDDGSFIWQAPFHPDVKLPWLDAEHDVGPAVIQLIKDGVKKWSGQKIALAYEMFSPKEVCRKFARGIGRPVRYKRGNIEIKVKVPAGYSDQLVALEKLYDLGKSDPTKQPPYFGNAGFEASCPSEALALWEGYRGIEEYAREVFPLEEAANGIRWMEEEEGQIVGGEQEEQEIDDDDESEGLTIGGDKTPARQQERWLA